MVADELKMSAVKRHKIKLREVNRHLVCRLCRGYYVDATTIAECLHSFCRSCIIKYLEKNSFCPICEVQIHTTKPHLSLRQDKALQDVVYKLVPGLYHNEMQRRREFYAKHSEQIPATTPEQCGIEDRIIFSPDEIISLSLERLDREEYVFESISSQSSEAGSDTQDERSIVPHRLVLKRPGKNGRRKMGSDQEGSSPRPKRYLRCPAAVDVSHLKKFIRMKYDLGERAKVDIIHKRVSLPDHYTLMDVAYIYTWKRNGPIRLFYYHGETWKEREKEPKAVPAPARAPASAPTEPTPTAEEGVTQTPAKEDKPVVEKLTKPPSPIPEVVKPKEEPVVGAPLEPNSNGSEEKTSPTANVATEIKPEKDAVVNGDDTANGVKTESVPSKSNDVPKKDDKLRKTISNLLKNYRKENGDGKGDAKTTGEGCDAETGANVPKPAVTNGEADVTIEFKTETKASEYDFESSSPPGKIIPLREFTKSEQSKNRKSTVENNRMSLQDLRKAIHGDSEDSVPKPEKIRLVPYLRKMDESAKAPKQNGKTEEKRKSPTIINIQTNEEDYRKKETKPAKESPPPITIENKGGEYSIRHLDENKKPEAKKRCVESPPDKKSKTEGSVRDDGCGAMDLSKSDAAKTEENGKNDENMVEALVSAAQKQSIEPLLRVPQFLKNSGSPPKSAPGRNISPSDISQALQFFKDIRSDIRILEAKSQQEHASKGNPFQLYQQQADLLKRLKKHHIGDYQPPAKVPKLSPPLKKSPDKSGSPLKDADATRVKSPVERALTQIQEQFELQNRMKQNLKNLPALLQLYNRPPFLYCPGASKQNQSKGKSPKSPPSNLPIPVSPGSSFFNQGCAPVVNAGLTSEMTFHQMFQNYLSQQEKMNQIKPPLGRPRQNASGSSNAVTDFYFGSQSDGNRSPPKQKI